MTYLVENETAALIVPARFIARLHPHFREVMQLLAVQAADEARHIEVFTRRATLFRTELGLSTAGGQASLKTLLDEQDFALASFLLSVLGEGSFLSLLWFIRAHAIDATLRERLKAAIERRHDALASTAGLNEQVFDALIVLAAGSFAPADLRKGHRAVMTLVADMDQGRRQRLERLGFAEGDAAKLSALHTRNFM